MKKVTIERCDGRACLVGEGLENVTYNMLELQQYVDELLASPAWAPLDNEKK